LSGGIKDGKSYRVFLPREKVKKMGKPKWNSQKKKRRRRGLSLAREFSGRGGCEKIGV